MALNHAPVLIFDAGCGLCASSVRWLNEHWRVGYVPVLLAAHTVTDEQLRQWSLTRDDLDRAAWWIEGDETLRGHLAAARALSHCRGVAAVVGHIGARRPARWLGALAYPVVARTRHLFSPSAASCQVRDAAVGQ